MGRMVRTNVVIDERLVRKVMDLYGLKSKRAAIHFALEHAARRDERVKKILALRGIGWGEPAQETVTPRAADR